MKKKCTSPSGPSRPRGPENGYPGGQSKSVGEGKKTKVKKNGWK